MDLRVTSAMEKLGIGILLATLGVACGPTNTGTDGSSNNDAASNTETGTGGEGGTSCAATDQFQRLPADLDQCAMMTSGADAGAPIPGFRAQSCNMMPFCPALVTNNPMRPNFILTQIDIQTPSVLQASGPIGSLLNSAIVQGTFFWGISLDFTAMTIRTGALNNGVQPQPNNGFLSSNFGYINGTAPMIAGDPMSPRRWDPVSGTITVQGDTVTSNMVSVIRVPVYDATDPTMVLTELPLRNLRMSNVRLSSNRNCVGTVGSARSRFTFNTCGSNLWQTQDTTMMPYSQLDGDMTIADARSVVVASLHQDLCRLLAGADCAMTPQAMWTGAQPDRLVDMATGSSSTMCGNASGMTPCNAWHLNARFAAVAANIQ